MVTFGRAFYEFQFDLMDDLRSLRSIGSWNLNPGVLRVFVWIPDFNPQSIKQTSYQGWARFHGLFRKYRCPKTLFEIGGTIGVPIALDEVQEGELSVTLLESLLI